MQFPRVPMAQQPLGAPELLGPAVPDGAWPGHQAERVAQSYQFALAAQPELVDEWVCLELAVSAAARPREHWSALLEELRQ